MRVIDKAVRPSRVGCTYCPSKVAEADDARMGDAIMALGCQITASKSHGPHTAVREGSRKPRACFEQNNNRRRKKPADDELRLALHLSVPTASKRSDNRRSGTCTCDA